MLFTLFLVTSLTWFVGRILYPEVQRQERRIFSRAKLGFHFFIFRLRKLGIIPHNVVEPVGAMPALVNFSLSSSEDDDDDDGETNSYQHETASILSSGDPDSILTQQADHTQIHHPDPPSDEDKDINNANNNK